MNMEVQSTERNQRPQLLNVAFDILSPTVLMPAWCSFLTITVVRVQGPGNVSISVFMPSAQYHGTILGTLDTLPKRSRLFLLLIELKFVHVAASPTLCAAAQPIRIA
jgi:hypothetical protein